MQGTVGLFVLMLQHQNNILWSDKPLVMKRSTCADVLSVGSLDKWGLQQWTVAFILESPHHSFGVWAGAESSLWALQCWLLQWKHHPSSEGSVLSSDIWKKAFFVEYLNGINVRPSGISWPNPRARAVLCTRSKFEALKKCWATAFKVPWLHLCSKDASLPKCRSCCTWHRATLGFPALLIRGTWSILPGCFT